MDSAASEHSSAQHAMAQLFTQSQVVDRRHDLPLGGLLRMDFMPRWEGTESYLLLHMTRCISSV